MWVVLHTLACNFCVHSSGIISQGTSGDIVKCFLFSHAKCNSIAKHLSLFFAQFCQPGGWNYSNYYKPPTFFVAVLTDMEGDHRYCACFTFHERCTPRKSKKKLANSSSKEGFRDESQSDSSLSEKRFSEMPGISVNSEEAVMMDVFAPKCLCLVSRASYFDILKVCLLL